MSISFKHAVLVPSVLVTCLCVIPLSAQAEIYRWVDAEGVVHYSDQPPPGVKTEQKAYNNVSTPFRKIPPGAFPKKDVVSEPPQEEPAALEPSETVGKPDNRGTAGKSNSVKFNDADKQTLSERKASIAEESKTKPSSLSERKSEIITESKKVLEEYKNRNQISE